MRLLSNKPIFEFPSEKIGIIKIRRLNLDTYSKINDAFPEIESVESERVVRFLFAIIGYWPDSLNENGEFQDKGFVGEENAEKLTKDELERFAEQVIDKDENLPYSRFAVVSKKQDNKKDSNDLERQEKETNVEYLHRIISIKAKENKDAKAKMLKAAMPLSIDEIFPKSSLDSIMGTLTASEQLMEQIEKMKPWYDSSYFGAAQEAFESICDTKAHADYLKDLVEKPNGLSGYSNLNHEPPYINDLHFEIPPNPIEGTNERLDNLLDHQKEAVKLTATSANLLTKMNDSFLRLIGDLRAGGIKTLIVAGLTLIVTLVSLGYAVYSNKQTYVSYVAMIESIKTLNDGMQEFLGQQNAILTELQNQNGNDAASQQMLGQLIEINRDMRQALQEQNIKPEQQVEPIENNK